MIEWKILSVRPVIPYKLVAFHQRGVFLAGGRRERPRYPLR